MVSLLTSCGDSTDKAGNISRNELVVVSTGTDSLDPAIRRLLTERIEAAVVSPSDGSVRGELAMAYEANGFEKVAMQTYEHATILEPQRFDWPYLLALLRAQHGEFDQAHIWLDRALAIRPDYVPAWLMKGNWLLDQNQISAAQSAFERAISIDDGLASQVGLARVYLAAGNPHLAAEVLLPLAGESQHPYVYRLLGTAWAQAGDAIKAAEVLELARQDRQLTWSDEVAERKFQYKAGFSVRLDEAESLVTIGEYEKALPILDELAGERPNHVVVLNLLGVAYSRVGSVQRAIDIFEHAINVSPDYVPAQMNLARVHLENGDYYKSMGVLDAVIEIRPSLGEAHKRRGIVLNRLGNSIDAKVALRKAIKVDARDPEAYYVLGLLEMSSERWSRAVEVLELGIQIDPQSVQLHVLLARCMGETNRFEEAETVLHRAEKIGQAVDQIQETREWLERKSSRNLGS